MGMKDYFTNEINEQINSIKRVKSDNDIHFALLSDTHLSDELSDTVDNIKNIDNSCKLDFIIHLGNILNGDNPEKISLTVYNDMIKMLSNSVNSGKVLVCQGENDGWRNERYIGQLVCNIMTDERWYGLTEYLHSINGVRRLKNKPYYYLDVNDDTRFVFLCPYCYQIDKSIGLYNKIHKFDIEQQKWLIDDALNVKPGTNIFLFSNTIPNSIFETGEHPYAFEGNSIDPTISILQKAMTKGVNICCWFTGGYGFDSTVNYLGINIVSVGNQAICINKCVYQGNLFEFYEREKGTITQDLWDSVIIKPDERKIYMIRFGAGADRIISY